MAIYLVRAGRLGRGALALMRLHLIRHLEPWSTPGYLLRPQRSASARHGQPARVLAALLARTCLRATPVFSSPLQRCAALAQRLSQRAAVFDARLAEMDFGAWEMRAWDNIARDEIDAWAADLLDYRPGGGENVLAGGRARRRLPRRPARAGRMPSAIVVCHAGTIRLLRRLPRGGALRRCGAGGGRRRTRSRMATVGGCSPKYRQQPRMQHTV